MTDQTVPEGLDGDAGEGAAKKAAQPGRKRRLAIIAAAAALMLGGLVSGAAWWLGLLGHGNIAERPPVFLELPEMTVNLSTVGNNPQYLRVKAALEMRNHRVAAAIEPVLPRVLDAFQVYLRELRSTDLEGSAGLFRLKEELVRRVNIAIHPAEIEGVVFQEIIVQ